METEGLMTGKPPGDNRDLGAGRGWQRVGRTAALNGGRCRHKVRGAETSGGGWHVVSVGNNQVENALHRERR